jgi:hypothetical protein
VKHPRRIWLALLGPIAAALIGCGREEPIRVYGTAAAPRPQTLETPAEWRRVNAGQVALYAFEAGQGKNLARISISLSGGTLLDNINRWRDQVGLGDIDQEEMEKQLTRVTIDQYHGHYVQMSQMSSQPGSDEKSPADGKPKPARKPPSRGAIHGVIIPAKGRTWFFKLEGSVAAVQREKDTFRSFVDDALRALALAVSEPASEDSADGK